MMKIKIKLHNYRKGTSKKFENSQRVPQNPIGTRNRGAYGP